MPGFRKTDFPVDKRRWSPSLIPGPLVLVSTRSPSGAPNVAPKSWVQMASFEPPILLFSGTRENPTEENILASGCFGVNLVHRELALKVHGCLAWRGEERIRRLGLGISPGPKTGAPLVSECRASLECRLEDTKEIGGAFIVFGRIVSASVWEEALEGTAAQRYARLDPALFLEPGLFAGLGTPISSRP